MKFNLKREITIACILITVGLAVFILTQSFFQNCFEEGLIPTGFWSCSRLIENTIPQVFALCEPNRDWQDAPCSDQMPVNRQEFKERWSAFYDYKGADWMESKKTELLEVIANGTFHEWDHSHENSNVYSYYLSIGEVPNQYEYFFFEDEIPPDLIGPLILIGSIIGGISATVVFVIRRKRK